MLFYKCIRSNPMLFHGRPQWLITNHIFQCERRIEGMKDLLALLKALSKN